MPAASAAVKTAVHRLRRRYQELLRAEVAQTVATPEEVEDELRDLFAAVRREIWAHQISFMSRPRRDRIEIPQHIWQRMQNALAYAA